MPDTGNTGPEGIVFVPDANLAAIGFTSALTGAPYVSTKGAGGLFFIAHQNFGYIWVYDINPNVNNDFAFVGKYRTNRSESCDLAFDRSTGLLYILHNLDDNYLEVTDMSIVASTEQVPFFPTVKEYFLAAPTDGNVNIEGFALMPKCGTGMTGSAWLCRDASNDEDDAILTSTLKWFAPFTADGNCTPLNSETFETSGISAYPNPFENRITISGLTAADATIQIYNSLGQLVGQQKSQSEMTLAFDAAGLKSGIYFLNVIQDGNAQTFKLYKK